MNPLICVSVTLYFEVSNSDMFGGQGSIGYSSVKFDDVKHLDRVNDEFITVQRQITADMLHVSPDDVRLISKEDYDKNTEDDPEQGNSCGECTYGNCADCPTWNRDKE